MSDEHVPRIAQSDRRYLRSGANRRVRKVRRMRVVARFAGLAAMNLALVSVVVLSGVQAARRVANSPEFALRSVVVEGAARTSAEAIRGRLARLDGRNLLELDLDAVASRCAEDPWVLSASVRRVLPDTLRIVIEERTPAALAVVDGLVQVVDRTGRVIGASGPDLQEDLPVITGLDERGGKDRQAGLERGVRALLKLQDVLPDWSGGISELDLSQADRIRLVTSEPGPTVLLDPEQVERNLETYLAMRGEIERCVGQTQSVDLRWNHRVSVLPAPAASSMEND